jgi:hypothetical protein
MRHVDKNYLGVLKHLEERMKWEYLRWRMEASQKWGRRFEF